MNRSLPVALLIGSLFISACLLAKAIPPTETPTAPPTVAAATTAPPVTTTPTSTVAPTDTPQPTDTTTPTATNALATTTAPSATTPPTAPPTEAATAGPAATGAPATYNDDRSTAASLMTSYVSALNLRQYVRAYYYWNPSAPQLKPFGQFQAGFAGTQSTQLTLGTITASGAAGQLYFNVPATLVAQTSGGTQTFVGCYILHLPQPAIQGAPPFRPLAIDQAQVQQVANNADTASLMAQACQNFPGAPLQVTPVPDPNDISHDRYLDDRTDAVQVIRSLFNAVNRNEYVRAYYYWEANAQGLPPFSQFQQGYANTAAVKLTTGTVSSDAGAGQRYYKVPVTLVSTQTNSSIQTFVGCYTLHLAVPDIQGVPPFQPLAIRSAAVHLVANNADTTALMAQVCQ